MCRDTAGVTGLPISECKMGDRDREKDERLWEGTVEEEEAYYSEAENRSVTNGNTR